MFAFGLLFECCFGEFAFGLLFEFTFGSLLSDCCSGLLSEWRRAHCAASAPIAEPAPISVAEESSAPEAAIGSAEVSDDADEPEGPAVAVMMAGAPRLARMGGAAALGAALALARL